VPTTLLTTEQILLILGETPGRISDLTSGLEPVQLRTVPSQGEWSANDVLAHLRACADMWGGRIQAMIAEDRPTLRAVSPRTWIRKTDYPELEFQASLRAFTTQRAELLAALERLPPAGWLREATVTGAGKSLVKTVHFESDGLARHERAHVKQIERIVRTFHA
jgi:hypothetical protein